MTWKSYAAVSGATLVAGWLASSTPAPEAPAGAPRTGRPPAASAASSNIIHEADRLQARVSRAQVHPVSERDPFRFADRRAAAAAEAEVAEAAETPIPAEPMLPAPPSVSLSGIAEDLVDGQPRRTAVLSTPSDVLLVREGDEILGRYRVVRIESEAVELRSVDDGVVLRLGLR